MSAYMIAQIEIDDPEEYQNYLAGFMPIFQRYGGELLATSKNETIIVEGEWAYPSNGIVVKCLFAAVAVACAISSPMTAGRLSSLRSLRQTGARRIWRTNPI